MFFEFGKIVDYNNVKMLELLNVVFFVEFGNI